MAENGREWDLKICFVGAGYVGGPTATVTAKYCPNYKLHVVDLDRKRIDAWNSEELPIFEPDLYELVVQYRGKNLFFSTEVSAGIAEADIVMVAVNTPTKTIGDTGYGYDLFAYESVARAIAKSATKSTIVVEKSTVPVKTADRMRQILYSNRQRPDIEFEVLSNPEFLAEGTAIKNLEDPDRVIIGGLETPEGNTSIYYFTDYGQGRRAVEAVAKVYSNWVSPSKIITTNLWSAELGKLASNAFLAQRVSSINAMSAICEASGANVDELKRIVGSDPRIGPQFLNASIGFGGSCLEKDLKGLIYLCEGFHLKEVADYWSSVLAINEYQKKRFSRLIVSRMFDNIKRKTIAILGFAFKKNTGDIRLSPAIDVCRYLLSEEAQLFIYDPKVRPEEIVLTFPGVTVCNSAYAAAREAHAVVILTEWDEFKTLDYEKIYKNMNRPAFVFDGRNILDHEKIRKIGFTVVAIGKNYELK